MSILLALLLQVGPDPMAGAMQGDDLVRDRPPRPNMQAQTEPEVLNPTSAWLVELPPINLRGRQRQGPMPWAQISFAGEPKIQAADRVLANTACEPLRRTRNFGLVGLMPLKRYPCQRATETPADERATAPGFRGHGRQCRAGGSAISAGGARAACRAGAGGCS